MPCFIVGCIIYVYESKAESITLTLPLTWVCISTSQTYLLKFRLVNHACACADKRCFNTQLAYSTYRQRVSARVQKQGRRGGMDGGTHTRRHTAHAWPSPCTCTCVCGYAFVSYPHLWLPIYTFKRQELLAGGRGGGRKNK